MYLTIEDDKIVIESISREQEEELLQMAEDRVPLEYVKADFCSAIDSPSRNRIRSMAS